MAQGSKAIVGKLGQDRGRVRSMGVIGGARGARFPGNGQARPGALNFLQAPGFGMHARDAGRGPEMNPLSGPIGPRHVSGPLPSQPLEQGWSATNPMPGSLGQNPNPLAGTPDTTPGYGLPDGTIPENYNPNPDPGMSIWGVPLDQGPQGPGAMAGVGSSGANSGLIPLGGGQYLDPRTGVIHGTGVGGGNQSFKAL